MLMSMLFKTMGFAFSFVFGGHGCSSFRIFDPTPALPANEEGAFYAHFSLFLILHRLRGRCRTRDRGGQTLPRLYPFFQTFSLRLNNACYTVIVTIDFAPLGKKRVNYARYL
jgi:hypothetical protein